MKKRVLYLLVAAILPLTLFAQQIKVKGKVMNLKGNPITATILVKSSKEKVTTDERGLFTVECNSKDKLKISAADYSPKTIKVNKAEFLEVILKNSGIDYSKYLSFRDIMIDIYSAIVVMEAADIYVISREDYQENEPLLYLDGVEVTLTTLITLPTANIKSIKVLRGQNETVMYGKRGSDGVIIVKTSKE